jgi:hypothetical protein
VRPSTSGFVVSQLELASIPPGAIRPRSKEHRENIYQAVVDLHNRNLKASRQLIADLTGLKLSIVDDHLGTLKTLGRIRTLYAGVFEPVIEFTLDRAISVTRLPGSLVKLELGDEIVTLNPSRRAPPACSCAATRPGASRWSPSATAVPAPIVFRSREVWYAFPIYGIGGKPVDVLG